MLGFFVFGLRPGVDGFLPAGKAGLPVGRQGILSSRRRIAQQKCWAIFILCISNFSSYKVCDQGVVGSLPDGSQACLPATRPP